MTTSGPVDSGTSHVELSALRKKTVQRITRIVSLLAWPLVAWAAYEAFSANLYGIAAFYTLVYLFVLLTAILEKRVSPITQASAVLLLAYGVAVAGLMQQGLASDARWFLMLPPVLAGLFFGTREGVIALGIALALILIFGALFALRILVPLAPPPDSAALGEWGLTAFIYLVLGGTILATQSYLLPNLIQAWHKAQNLAEELGLQHEELVKEAERSRKRARRFERAAELSRTLARLTDQAELLQRLPQAVAQTFDLYQVNLYTVDSRGERLLLVAAATPEAQALVERGFVLAMTEAHPVARAALLNAPEMQLTGEHPFFPESKAMTAIPLSVRGELLGVLEIHGRYEAFDEDDVYLFRILSDQLAALWASLRLVAESEARLAELRALYARYAGTAWVELLRQLQVAPVQIGQLDPQAVQALKAEVLAKQEPRSALIEEQYVLVLPLMVRGLTLGVIAISRPAAQGDWPQETVTLLRNAAERLAFALDNTRLLVESQRRALYEEQLSHIGEAVWAASGVEGVMERGVAELGRLLGASDVALWLTTGTSSHG